MLRDEGPYRLGDGYLTADVDMELRVLTYDFVGDSPEATLLDSIQK